jgi:lysophospholipase L1-like esterase
MKKLSFVLFLMTLLAILYFGVTSGWDWNTLKGDGTKAGNWTGAWTAPVQAPLEEGISHNGFHNQTVRMILKPQIDGKKIRIRLSNTFSSEPLSIEEVHIAVSKKGSEIISDTDLNVLFEGKQKVTIPPGENMWSDPLHFNVNSNKSLAVSIYVREKTGPATWHPRSMQTNYITNGNETGSSDWPAFRQKEKSWFWLDTVDVLADSSVKGSIVVLGSSIANGNHSTLDANHRWPDYLAERMKDSDTPMSVLNAGISANKLIESTPDKGESAGDRLNRDVFDQTAVKAVILHQGLNDIRHHPEYSAKDIIKKMKEIIEKTHDQGLKIYGGTLTPYKESGMYTEEGEETRQEVNDWIRTSGEFDGVIDFDKALRDPEDPERYLPEYDAGDHLHPNDAGYKVMAEAVDLSMFKKNKKELDK